MNIKALALAIVIATAATATAQRTEASATRNKSLDQYSTMEVIKGFKSDIEALKSFEEQPIINLTNVKGKTIRFQIVKVNSDSVTGYHLTNLIKVNFELLSAKSVAQLLAHQELLSQVPNALAETKSNLEIAMEKHSNTRRKRVTMNRSLYFHKYTTKGQFKRIGRNEYPTLITPSAF